MASAMTAKRPRAHTNGVNHGRASQNKRPRHSTADLSDGASEEERADASGSEEPAGEDPTDAQEHDQMIWATQQVQRDFKANANKQNIATDSGIIEEIQCINFMCHEHLTVTLGPLINFIIGHNGSGKSAVLTALTICLGGKAAATNRAQNLKSLIKEGKEHSSVQVKIKNQGPLAYKAQQYGDSILVERHFNRSGTSGFKLKDRNGRIVSTKKAELEDILDAFSMQIDNPMNVLTQDMARQFLNHSTPKDKYKFFLQGTQLENLNRDYQQIEASLELMNTKADVKKEDIKVLRKTMEEYARKARRAENLEKMRAKEKEVAHQALWAEVEAQERQLREEDEEIARLDGLIARRQEAVEEATEAFERSNAACEAAQQTVSDTTIELDPVRQQEQEAKEKFDESKLKLIKLKADERKAGSDVTAKTKEKRKIEAEIEQLRQRQAEADNGRYAEKVAELEAAKVRLEDAKQALAQHGVDLPTIKRDLSTTYQEKGAADQKVEKAREEERAIRKGIQRLREGQQNWIEAYPQPQNLQNLLRAIDREGRFREQPVGPMGRHVKLLQPEWGHILEKSFGLALNAFVVTSKADQAILSDLMRRNNWQAPIYIGRKEPIDTTQHEPDSKYLTWMKALRIDDHLVRNQFIINQSMEQTILIESRAEGAQIMHARGPATRNVTRCFTFADGDKRRGRTLQFTPAGGVNDSPIDEYKGALRMQADKDDQIRTQESRLDGIRREIQELERAASELQNRLNACKTTEQDHIRKGKQLHLASQRAQDAVDRLEDALSDAAPDAAGIEVLQDSLAAAEQEIQNAAGVFQDMVVQRDKLNQESRTNKNNLEAAQNAVAEIEFKLSKAQSTVRKFQGKREDDLKQKNHVIDQVKAAERNRAEWAAQREKTQEQVNEYIDRAQQTCPERVPVPPGKTSEELGNLLQRLVNTRREAEKELGGSQEELLRAANQAKKIHQEARKEFDDIESLKMHLINTLNNRRNRWQQFRSGISVRARVTFNYLLSERKFRGTLNIDHKKGLLDIHVQPDIMERSADGRQTKTLSGGEKSYSTVCLLLSLWDAMGSPIRCLDEFDVFMDSVNRDQSMKLIIQAARRSIGRQFIFITPQAMNNVTQDSDVKIIKMSDPERGQTAINFSG